MKRTVLKNYIMADIHQQGLQQVLNLKDDYDTQIIIIDMPLHPSFVDYFPHLSDDYQIYLDTICHMSETAHIPLWLLSTTNFIPNEYWRDRHHLNNQGATYFSYWLGEQLGMLLLAEDNEDSLFQDPSVHNNSLPTEIPSPLNQ